MVTSTFWRRVPSLPVTVRRWAGPKVSEVCPVLAEVRVKSVKVRVAPSRVSEAENGVSGFVAKSGTTRVWRWWSNSIRRNLLSICGLVEESIAADGCGASFVCPGFQPKSRTSSARVVRARAGGGCLVEESIAVDGCGASFVCPGFEPKSRTSSASVVRPRAGGRVMVGGYRAGGYRRGSGIGLSWTRVASELRTIPFTFVGLALSREFHDDGGRVWSRSQTRWTAETAPPGLKPGWSSSGHAALKGRSSTVLRAFVWFCSSTGGSVFLLGPRMHFGLDSRDGAKVKVMGRNDTKPYGSRGGCFALHDLACRFEVDLRWPRAFFWRAAG